MIRISLVSYSNTLPFKVALESSVFIKQNAILRECHPAQCAKEIFSDLADIALIPVGALEKSDKYEIVTDYCIAAKNRVESVLLLSEKPKSEIREITLDYQSRTSVKLIKVINNNFWKFNYRYADAKPGFEKNIIGSSAALVIGDRALNLRNSFPYVYDLAEEWHNFTELPAVFAVWVAKKEISREFMLKFNDILSKGNSNRAAIAKRYSHIYKGFNLEDYLVNCIDYYFDQTKIESMNLFLKLSENI